MTYKSFIGSNALLAVLLTGAPAYAQSTPQNQPEDQRAVSVDDVIVTAERREQRLQDVPIAVSAISAQTLEARGIADIRQIQQITPGFRVVEVGQQPSIQIRGVGTIVSNVGNDSSASFNLDNVPVARPLTATASLFDLERVEILKGPQGTLYGRNATAGALNVLTRKPMHDFELLSSVRLGNYNLRQAMMVVNLPIADTLAVRAGVQGVTRDGYLSSGADDADSLAGRVRVLWDPTENFSLLLTAGWNTLGGQGPGDVPLKNAGDYLNPNDPWFLATNSGTPNGIYQDGHYGNSVPGFGQYQDIDGSNFTVEMNWDLGPVTLTVIPAHLETDYKATTYNGGFAQNISATDEQDSLEARLTSQYDSPLSWIAGVFYLKDDQTALNDNHITPTVRSFSATPYLDLTTYAVFGQMTYALTDKLNFTAGVRYTNDRKETQSSVRNAPLSGIGGVTTTSVGDQEWSYTSYRVGADYHITPDNLIYANVSDAYKSGGINRGEANGPAGPAAYDPEHLTSYQIGSRNDFFDGRLRLNLEAWYWDYQDLQALSSSCINIPGGTGGGPVFCPLNTTAASVTRNVGTSTNKGVEVESIFRLTRSDVFNFNVSYIDGKYEKAYTFPFTLDGQTTPRTPKWTGMVSYKHTFDISDGSKIDFFVSDQFQSSMLRILQPIVGQKEEGWHSVSVDLSYTSSNRDWIVAIWGDNLNEDDHTVFAGQTFVGLWGHPTPPRTFGIRLSKTF